MSKILRLRGHEVLARRELLNKFYRLCRDDPLSAHCYSIYYLMREPHNLELLIQENVESYVLIRYGGKFTIEDVYEVHIWNPISEVISEIVIRPSKRANVQLHGNYVNSILDEVIEHLKYLGFKEVHISEFHDMICDSESFRPSPLERLAVRLGEEHAQLYRDLEVERGVSISLDEARRILNEYLHYGVIVDDILVSVAARYVTLPEIHIIGGVFTRRKYRGRGYAKAVVSALTREAISSRAFAGLQAERGNRVA